MIVIFLSMYSIISMKGDALMVQKFYALLKKNNHFSRIINAFEALRLVDSAEILTKPKSRSVLFDVDTQLNVYPVRSRRIGGQPYFRYYSDMLNVSHRPETIVYTPELITFLGAFENISRFIIKDVYTDEIVMIFPQKMEKLKRIKFNSRYYEEDYAILKFYVDIAYTYPYSNYYKWNGHLGIEFIVSSQSSPPKRRELGEQGIPLFEAKATFPKYIKIPEEFETEEQYTQISLKIRETYQERNYKLFGAFRNNAVTSAENERKYKALKTFEEQFSKLSHKNSQLDDLIRQKKDYLRRLQEEIVREEEKLKEYNSREEYFKNIEFNNQKLLSENGNLKDRIVQCNSENQQLKVEKQILNDNLSQKNEEIHALKNRSFFDRLLNK